MELTLFFTKICAGQVNEPEKDQMVISDVKRIQPESKISGQEVGESLSQRSTFKLKSPPCQHQGEENSRQWEQQIL